MEKSLIYVYIAIFLNRWHILKMIIPLNDIIQVVINGIIAGVKIGSLNMPWTTFIKYYW